METNSILSYHHRGIGTQVFEGKKKRLELVLFSLLRSCSVRSKVEVL